MQVTFSRSLRALQRDMGWQTAVYLFLPLLLLLVWLGWFLLATVPVYQTSHSATFTSSSRITAAFPPAALTQIQPNQSAQLRLDDFPWAEHGTLAATVVAIDSQVRDGFVSVELQTNHRATQLPLQRELTTQVEIETAQLTPVELLLQTLNQQLFSGEAS